MNHELITYIWIFGAPVLIVIGWIKTKNAQPDYYRILLRSLIFATCCGFIYLGGIVPAWTLLTPDAKFFGIIVIFFWWFFISVIYLIIHAVIKKLTDRRDQFY